MNVLDSWKTGSLDELLADCRELVEDPDFPTVRRWREAGGKVLGHFQVYFPEEIAHAAGMLPVKVRGAPVEARLADSHFGSYLCSILRSSLEVALTGRLQLDMFVTHPICDAARNLAGVWARNFTYSSQILYLPQNANSGFAANYLRDEYARVQRDIERVTDRSINDDDLRRSIAVFNRNRHLCRELYAIKRETPWLLSADEAYVLVNVGGMIPREEHNQLSRARYFAGPGAHRQEARSDTRGVRGRILRATAARPAADDRPVLLRRGRRSADRAALDRGRRAARRRSPDEPRRCLLEQIVVQPGAT